MSESIPSKHYCQTPLYGQSDLSEYVWSVRIPCMVSQTCQNPLYDQSDLSESPVWSVRCVRIPCMISQTCQNPLYPQSDLSESPVSSVRPVRIPCILRCTLTGASCPLMKVWTNNSYLPTPKSYRSIPGYLQLWMAA